MPTLTLLYIILAILFSVVIAYFQYFFKVKNTPKNHILLFSLRAISIFLLLLLFINPKVKLQKTENIKPKLSVLVDNSLSTTFFKEKDRVLELVRRFKGSNKLNDKFDVNFFEFGKDIDLTSADSLQFNDSHTNINKAIKSVNSLFKDEIAPMILISDGNQTIGEDYEYINSKQPIYPIVIGGTVKYDDIKISQLNVNKYSYLNNKFPVEAFVYYDGDKEISPTFTIYKSGKKVFTKKIELSKEKKSVTILTNLLSDKEGIDYYSASISQLPNEKNTRNNTKSFSVEVIDEQSKVLILSSILHPDLGAFKNAIESNKQRKVTIAQINSFKGDLEEYQFVIFYQPTFYFKSFLEKRTANFLIVTGTKTDWNFINSLNLGIRKSYINQSENYNASYNPNYLTFIQENIGFNSFPPLKDKFGAVDAEGNQTLLFQKLQNITTNEPLLATIEKGERKYGMLLGEGIWKWRASSYIKESSFEVFDEFVNNLVQFLSSNEQRKRLDVKIENLYLANEPITISALYLDSNFKFDNRASIQISLINNETKEEKVIPFSLINNSYQVKIEGLSPGEYNYHITVEGQPIQKKGKFKVADFQIEEQFSYANTKKLASIANSSEGKMYYPNQQDEFIQDLIKNDAYVTIQKSIEKEEDLIHWKWILFLVISLLTIEWFLRKYLGKI
ncbi:VWA domain-containing protein [Tenacibaculum amylolyticum]|uniref:VWA domain-containing protein n=1 Tax=Tenacibaculum amylolyticum TaxID=104269 RepID=UPI0038B55094